MFTYLHGYMKDYWDGLVKRGFIDDTSGVKFPQNLLTFEEDKFNSLACEGSDVYNIVKEANRPFYVDRLQGGGFYDKYVYDRKLISHYLEMLGDRFIGFQMHEWISNYMSDWKRITEEAGCTDMSEEGIEKAVKKVYGYPNVFLEAGCAAEYAHKIRPENAAQLTGECRKLFEKRQESVLGCLLPADSFYTAPKLESELGARYFMPEVGAQIPNMRIQLALTRGEARAYHKKWGVYYEPWGGEPFGVCYYKKDNINEWNIRRNEDFPFKREGGNGGSSRKLQKRIHTYAYLSGASFISEEWGVCNTFYDWHDYEITDYGKVKLDFLRFVKKYPDVGRTLTPFAIVLPEDFEIVNISNPDDGRYVGFDEEAYRYKSEKINRCLKNVFGNMDKAIGNEAHVMKNGGLPDAFDIVNAGDENALSEYDYLIDLTCDEKFAKEHKNIVKLKDAEAVLRKILPCYVDGEAHWTVNKTNCGYFLAVFNNNGVYRSVEKGEILLPEAKTKVRISLKDSYGLKLLENDGEFFRNEDGTYSAELPASGWIFAKIG